MNSPRKLRVLIAIMDLHGGAGVFCRYLAEGLKRYHSGDVEVEILTWRDRGFLASDEETFARIHKLNLPVRRGVLRGLDIVMDVPRLRRVIGGIEPDLVVTAGTYANLMVPLATARPVVLTEHNHLSTLFANNPRSGVLGKLIRLRYRDRPLVVPSQGVADDLRENFGASNLHVIPHGLDAERMRLLAEQRVSDLPPTLSYVVACGRLAAQKDYPTMLRGYALARAEGLSLPLVILGDGPDLGSLQALALSLGVESHVQFLGHRDNPFPYIAGARCYVLSSLWEGFGLALLEAMTLGRPVISTDCPAGPGEILEGGAAGQLVTMSSPEELAKAMVAVTGSEEAFERYSRLSLARSGEFSLEKMAKRYCELFQRLV